MATRAPIKVGIVGFGGSANVYNLPYILPNPDIEVYAFLQRKAADDRNLGRFGHCTTKFPKAKHYRTAEEISSARSTCGALQTNHDGTLQFFGDPAIELVVVTTSTGSHATLAEQALRANKHVVVEKPFTTSSASATDLIALARSKNLILSVYQNRRWDSEFLTLKHLVASNAFGPLTDVQIHYDVPFPAWIAGWTDPEYRAGEGMLFGLGSHSIDQALQLLGTPSKVTGWIRCLRPGVVSEVDDTFMVVLEYTDKPTICTVKTTVVNVLRDPLKYFVRGRQGSFVKFGECKQEEHTFAGKKATDEGFGVDEERLWGTLTTKERVDENQAFDEASQNWVGAYPTKTGYWRGLYENVVGAIRGEAELEVKPEQSRDGIRVMELARQSWKEGRTLPWSS